MKCQLNLGKLRQEIQDKQKILELKIAVLRNWMFYQKRLSTSVDLRSNLPICSGDGLDSGAGSSRIRRSIITVIVYAVVIYITG